MPAFLAYPLGRGQEIVHVLCQAGIRTGVHGAIARYVPVYEAAGVSRIRALTEESTVPSVTAFTVAVVAAFFVMAFAAMLLWHLYVARLN